MGPGFPYCCIADRLIEVKEPKMTVTNAGETAINKVMEIEEHDSTDDIDSADEDEALYELRVIEPTAEELQPALSAVGSEAPCSMLPAKFEGPAPRSEGEQGEYSTRRGNGHAGDNGFDTGEAQNYATGEEPRGALAARYIYKDARGLLYMRVTRTSSKTFPTQHWRDGRWVNGWPPGPVIPYRLPELLAAPASEPVFICEGEKDADNVAALGLVATTNPGGAKVWQPELAQWFKGKQLIYVIEDNDDAGREHARKIIAALHETVPAIVTVAFPELPEKSDVSDWLEVGGNKKLLLARAAEAHKCGKGRRNYTLVELHTLQLEATDWLWEGHLICGELELIAGRPGVGKSQVQCQMIACVTTGRNWPDGQKGPRPGRVILITAEDKAQDYHKRLLAAQADLSKVKLLKYVRRNNRDEMFLLSHDLDKLEQAIIDLGDVRLVAIDPITAFMGTGKHFDSHRATDVRSQLGPLGLLAEKVNVAFSTVTHPPKSASQRALDHFIGSQAYIAIARIGHICIDEMTDGGNGTHRPSGRMLFANPKNNFSALVPTLAYRIEPVRLGWDAKRERDIMTSVVRWEGPLDLTADEALAVCKPRQRDQNSAQEFLLDILAAGPVLVTVIVERGAKRGFSYDQLKRAKRIIGVDAFKKREAGMNSPWLWALPQHVPAAAESDPE
jgi:hypothetical protein